ncbi:MAG: hypothetical protein KA108_09285 [Candidatus Fermentibacter sp.]|nr:hypothetical protein [Candidatus Fermentibacter sp.]
MKIMPGGCYYCGSSINLENDHVRAKSKGGVTTVVACAACNRSKGSKALSEWLRWLRENDSYRWGRIVLNQEKRNNRVSQIVRTILKKEV